MADDSDVELVGQQPQPGRKNFKKRIIVNKKGAVGSAVWGFFGFFDDGVKQLEPVCRTYIVN